MIDKWRMANIMRRKLRDEFRVPDWRAMQFAAETVNEFLLLEEEGGCNERIDNGKQAKT